VRELPLEVSTYDEPKLHARKTSSCISLFHDQTFCHLFAIIGDSWTRDQEHSHRLISTIPYAPHRAANIEAGHSHQGDYLHNITSPTSHTSTRPLINIRSASFVRWPSPFTQVTQFLYLYSGINENTHNESQKACAA